MVAPESGGGFLFLETGCGTTWFVVCGCTFLFVLGPVIPTSKSQGFVFTVGPAETGGFLFTGALVVAVWFVSRGANFLLRGAGLISPVSVTISFSFWELSSS